MNRFNSKLYYKPPPVKPSKKLQNQQQPEWNSYQTDLNRYKLSNAEAIKKKINAVSKNLESAKKEYQNMILSGKIYADEFQNDYYDPQNKKKIIRKKIDLTPMNRFEKKIIEVPNKANLMKGYNNTFDNKFINKRSKSGMYRKTNQNSDIQNLYEVNQINKNKGKKNESDDEEIKMIYNSNVNMTIAETKAKNNSLNYLNEKNNYYSNIQKPELFSEFDKTIQKMQDAINENQNENIQKVKNNNKINNKNKRPQTALNQNNKRNNINQQNIPKKNNKDLIDNQFPTFEMDDENINLDNVNEIQNNINQNFSKLNDLDQYMKKLDMMIDDSKKKSMNSQYHKDIIGKENEFKNDEMNDNYNLNQNYKNKKEMSFPLKDIPQTIQVNQDFEEQDKRIEINDEYNNPIEINPNPEIIEDKDNIPNNNNINFARSFGNEENYEEINNPYIQKFEDKNIKNYNNIPYNYNEHNEMNNFSNQNYSNYNNSNFNNNNNNNFGGYDNVNENNNDNNNINFARSYSENDNYDFKDENIINQKIPKPTQEVKKYTSPIYSDKINIPNSYTNNNKTYINVQENRNIFNNDNVLSNKIDIYNNIPLYKNPNSQFEQNNNIPFYQKQNNQQINNNPNNNFSYITNLLSQTKEEIEKLTKDIDSPSINLYKYNNNRIQNY